MNTLLVVDDDEAMRRMIRVSLGDSYKIIDTGEPEQALALALEPQAGCYFTGLKDA